jgi:tungstate transport system ATP-binding protein
MVFQRPVLLRRSVRANIEHALSARQLSRPERMKRTDSVLEKTGLLGLAERDARVLSGGEQQRLALARAWALRPRILFLDEPTAHLDPAATASVEAIIRDIDGEGVRILMVSHDLGQVRRMAGDVLFLHNGHLIAHTDTRSFLDAPESELTSAFVEGRLLW